MHIPKNSTSCVFSVYSVILLEILYTFISLLNKTLSWATDIVKKKS